MMMAKMIRARRVGRPTEDPLNPMMGKRDAVPICTRLCAAAADGTRQIPRPIPYRGGELVQLFLPSRMGRDDPTASPFIPMGA